MRYIGKKLSSEFVADYYGTGKNILSAIKEYGKSNFYSEILEWCESIDELNAAERKWIKYYNAQEDKNFYNICMGGQWGNNIDGMNLDERESYIKKLSFGVKKSYINNPKLIELRSTKFRESATNRKMTDIQKQIKSKQMRENWENNYDKMYKMVKEVSLKRKQDGSSKEVWKIHKHPSIGRKLTEQTKQKIREKTNNHGINNPNRKSGIILLNDSIVFTFDITLEAHKYLAEKGITRRERYKMIHGDIIKNYRIIQNNKSQTTIENTDRFSASRVRQDLSLSEAQSSF